MKRIICKRILSLICLFLIAAAALSLTACDRTVKMDGTSMEPTIMNGQEITLRPINGSPSPGDIVLFTNVAEYNAPIIKRVIAVAGQELRIDFDNNEVYVDGVKLDEPYTQGATVRGDIPEDEINGVIPYGKVFVLGDSRTVSLDSRHRQIGLINVEDITDIVVKY